MTRAVAVWPQACHVHLSGAGYHPCADLTLPQAIHEARQVHATDPLLSGEIAACVIRLWAQRAAGRAAL